ncbi:MAG: NAD(P) transhydrogenase subunit alpha [Parvularculaceae bacterium]
MAENDKENVEEAARAAGELASAAQDAAGEAGERAADAAAAAGEARNIAAALGSYADLLNSPSEFVYLLAVFVLAIFVGYYVVWSVTPALHTPLMAVTNAISSVVIVGALIAVGAEIAEGANGFWPKLLGVAAVALASVNIFGGFLVTQRMLSMYKKKGA